MVPTIAFVAATVQDRIVSPEVHSDRTVTFRIKAPNAVSVKVGIEGSKGPLTLTKDASGLWSGTSAPLAPDIYGYSFDVDGTPTLDPNNPQIKPNLIWIGNMVTVKGDKPELWETQNVPRGQVNHHFFHSGVIGDNRDYYVYTPPGYAAAKTKLPVLYLLHGYSDIANGWTEVGKAHIILDNLLAQKKVKPMIVVMTLGYGIKGFAIPGDPNFIKMGGRDDNAGKYEECLFKEVIPMVEKGYRASTKRDDRAICGLSMGGAESLYVGLKNADKFSAVGAFSSGGFPAEKPEDVLPKLTGESTKHFKAMWMTCGTDDGLISFQRTFSKWLTSKGVQVKTQETKGGHEWMLWRRALAEFTQMIWK